MVAYSVAVFGALQGLDIIVSRLDLPASWMKLVVVASLAGLPVAAVLAWIFDWTPEGVVRTAPAPALPSAPAARASGLQLVALASSVAIAVAVAWLTWRQAAPPEGPPAPPPATRP